MGKSSVTSNDVSVITNMFEILYKEFLKSLNVTLETLKNDNDEFYEICVNINNSNYYITTEKSKEIERQFSEMKIKFSELFKDVQNYNLFVNTLNTEFKNNDYTNSLTFELNNFIKEYKIKRRKEIEKLIYYEYNEMKFTDYVNNERKEITDKNEIEKRISLHCREKSEELLNEELYFKKYNSYDENNECN